MTMRTQLHGQPKHITVMKRYYIYLIAFLFIHLSIVRGQDKDTTKVTTTEDQPASSITNITIDFGAAKPTFDHILPFDKIFILHLKNIPDGVDHITFRLQTDRTLIKNYRSDGNKSTANSANDILFEWTRPLGSSTKEGDIITTTRLNYNTEYIVKIVSFSKRPLEVKRQADLKQALTSSTSIAAAISKLAHDQAGTSGTVLIKRYKDIITIFGKAVKNIDSSYIFQAPPISKALSESLTYFHQAIIQANVLILEIKALNFVSSENKQMLRDEFDALQWAYLDTTMTAYKAFMKTADDIGKNEPDSSKGQALVVRSKTDALTKNVKDALLRRDTFRDMLISYISSSETSETAMVGTTYDTNFVNSVSPYITLDIGEAVVARIDRVLTYSGVNIFFRPIDKSIPLNQYTGWSAVGVRTSILLGISLASIDKDKVRKGLFGDKAGVVGLGYRVWSFLKLNAGFFCHYRYDTNPAISTDRYHLSTSPFVSISIDADVKRFFSAFGTPFSN